MQVKGKKKKKKKHDQGPNQLLFHPDGSSTKARVLKGVLFHTALDQFPKPLTFQRRAALSHSHSQTQKSAPYFLGKLPAEDMSANVMFSLILNWEIAVTSTGPCCQETYVTYSQ